MSVEALSSIPSYSYIPPTPSNGVEEVFAVQPSPLRNDAMAAAEEIANTQANTFVDPADAAKFSRDFPQILMQGAFAAPILETQAPTASESAGDVSLNYLWQGDSIRPGGESGKAIPQAAELAAPGEDNGDDQVIAEQAGEEDESSETTPISTTERNAAGEPMSEEEQVQVQELRNRDREVRVHEQAHQAAGGQYAGGASYTYQQGPDGQRYAVGGEVSIDVSTARTPEDTVAKMQQVRAAALAPAEPSSQDRAVASSAQAAEMEARSQLAEQRMAESRDSAEEGAGAVEAKSGTATVESGQALLSPNRSDESNPTSSGPIGAMRSSNPFQNAYRNQTSSVESGYGARLSFDPILASAMGYRSIDVVA